MKRCLLIFSLIAFSIVKSSGQSTTNSDDDSVKQILCRKWVISRITMAGQPINSSGLATTYDFKTDYSVVRTWEQGVKKGIWSYDSINHVVRVVIKKKDMLYVKFLTTDEFEIATTLTEDPNELLPTKVYFKPSQD